jgi:hypothetical protein
MNTTIIILGVLILVVIIAIVAVLVKGKSPKEENPEKDSGMTFKDDSANKNTPESQSQVATPQLHQQVPTTQPVQNAPVLNDLNTPMPQAGLQAQSAIPTTNSTDSPINQPNPLPNEAQMESDMANLESSMNAPNPAPVIPTSEVPTQQETSMPNSTVNDGISDVTNSINSQLQQPVDQSPIQPTVTEEPIADVSTTAPVADQQTTIPNPMTTTPAAKTPMEEETSAIDLDSPVVQPTEMGMTPEPLSEVEENNPMTQTPITDQPTIEDVTPTTPPLNTQQPNTEETVPPVTPPPVTPM